MKLRGNKIPRFFVQYSHWERRKLRCFFFSALGFGIFTFNFKLLFIIAQKL